MVNHYCSPLCKPELTPTLFLTIATPTLTISTLILTLTLSGLVFRLLVRPLKTESGTTCQNNAANKLPISEWDLTSHSTRRRDLVHFAGLALVLDNQWYSGHRTGCSGDVNCSRAGPWNQQRRWTIKCPVTTVWIGQRPRQSCPHLPNVRPAITSCALSCRIRSKRRSKSDWFMQIYANICADLM